MAKLSYQQKKRLHKESFAIPAKRKYPIPDLVHARVALARAAQHGTDSEQAQVKRAVYKKFPSLKP